ncbi:MAG TPA: AAA family ATPase, partial [Solirubrobacteraceae bacterium]|nr:AAA family ATPase [Solirubrobacteraceae bacterium]
MCGRFQATFAAGGGELPGPQARLLFAYLALSPTGAAPRDELIEAIWPHGVPENPRAALRTLLSRVRSALPPGTLQGGSELRLALPEDRFVDVEEARRAGRRLSEAAVAGRWQEAARLAERVAELTRGELMAGLDAPWLRSQREALGELRLSAVETLARAALQPGGEGAARALPLLRELVAGEPYRESAHVLLMEALAAEGNVAHALIAYDSLRQRLLEDLGTMPGRAARALHQRLLRVSEGGVGPLPPALPQALEQGASRPFVGRGEALEFVAGRLTGDEAVEGGLVFVAGEPGVGKTSLAARFARRSGEGGTVVLYGACNEESLLPFEPFVAALRPYVLDSPLEALRRQVSEHAPELLVRVLPELAERLPHIPPAPPGQETERYRLFEAVGGLLTLLGGERPALLVLDDLHWADSSTVQLLAHLARRARLAILGTYRPGELTDGHPLLELQGELGAQRRLHRLELDGLGEEEVSQLVQALSGSRPDRKLARALRRKTAGNPFFLGELLSQLPQTAPGAASAEEVGELSRMGVPEGVKEVIARRLSRLGEGLRVVLPIAAVAGPEFRPGLVEPLCPLGEEEFLSALEEGMRAGLLVEVRDGDGLAFSHVLIREALYESLSHARRRRLHARLAGQLERLEGLDGYARASGVAHHHLAAGEAGDPAAAARFAGTAGRLAESALAHESAARHYERALQALSRCAAGPRERWEVAMALGAACIKAGENERGRRVFADAAGLARRLGDPECLALAALGYGSGHGSGVGVEWGVPDRPLVELLEEALALLPDQDGPLRARVLARLAVALYFVEDVGRRDALGEQANAMARRIGDMATLAVTLSSGRGVLWGTDDLRRRLAATGEIRRLAEELGDPELRLQGHFWAIVDYAESGDVAAVDSELVRFAALADAIRQPVYLWYAELFGAMRRLLDWDLAGRRAHIHAAVEIGMRMNDPNIVQGAGVQLLYLRREQGRIEEMEHSIGELARQYDTVRGWWGLLGFLYVEMGRHGQAREALARLPADVGAMPRDANWLPSMAYLSEACALLGERALAARLYELLTPYADRNVIVGPAVVCLGS